MADLKAGTTIGGAGLWNASNLQLNPSGNSVAYRGFKIYTENDKPLPLEIGALGNSGEVDFSGVMTMSGDSGVAQLKLTGSKAGIELGNVSGTAGTPYIDFHTSGANTDYDLRLIARANQMDLVTLGSGKFKLNMPDLNVVQFGQTSTTDIKGYGGDTFIRDFGNGNVTISALRTSAGNAGVLYLGYNNTTNTQYTSTVRLESPMSWKGATTLINGDGKLVSVNLDVAIYGQTESNSRFVLKAGDTITGALTVGGITNFNGLVNFNNHDQAIQFSSSDNTKPIIGINYSAAGNFGLWDATASRWVLRKDVNDIWYMVGGLRVAAAALFDTTVTATGSLSSPVINATGAFSSTAGFAFSGASGGSTGVFIGNGDNATYTTQNMNIKSWYGIGFSSSQGTNGTTTVINTRTGDFSTRGTITGDNMGIFQAEVRTKSQDSYRLTSGTTSVYQRFDGNQWYFMLSDTTTGNYNNLRPLFIDKVNGNVTMGHGASVNGWLAVGNKGNGWGSGITLDDSDSGFRSGGDGVIQVWTNNTRKMHIDGTQVYCDTQITAASGVYVAANGVNVQGGGIVCQGGDLNQSNDSFSVYARDVYIRSDIRVKKDLRIFKNASQTLAKVNGYLYLQKKGFNEDGSDHYVQSAGLIAQEIQGIIPELISEDKEGGLLRLNYNGVIGLHTAAINEHTKELDAYKQRIEQLEKLVASLIK